MENNKQENKKSSVNIVAVLLAFVMGLCAGNISSDKIYPDKNADTTSASLISRAPTKAKPTEKAKQKTATTAKTQSEAVSTSDTDSFTVYITPTGRRYHLRPVCAGDNKIESDLDEAATKGLTPCKKCANG